MAYGFLDIATTSSVIAAQAENGSRSFWAGFAGKRRFDRFTEVEAAFIEGRDSFYIATVSASGWPYIQHRGGPVGFLRMLGARKFGFADFRGNRQYITLGNVNANDRAALFLMDYASRRRLKLFTRIEISDEPALISRLAVPGYVAKVERAMVFHLEAFDWNCPQHITPRFTKAELAQEVTQELPLYAEHLHRLETEIAALRAQLSENTGN